MSKNNSIIADNRVAHFNYQIIDNFEAGIVLTGQEIKAIRDHKLDLKGSYVRIFGSPPELFWVNGHIAGDDPERTRKLLVHKSELNTLIGKVQEKGLALVPLNLHLKRGRAKLSVGIGRGKKTHDKREAIKKRDLDREARTKGF